MIRAAVLIGGTTIFAAIAIAMSSTSRLSMANTLSRDTALIEAVERRVEARLASVTTMLDKASGRPGNTAEMLNNISVVFESSPSHLDEVLVTDAEGKILLALKQGAEPADSAVGLPAFLAAASGKTGYLTVHQDDKRWQLWAMRTTLDDSGNPLYVLARLDVGFLDEAVEAVAEGATQRSILVMHRSYLLTSNSRAENVRLDSATWTAGGGHVGSVSLKSAGGRQLQGYFRDFGVLEGLGWRVVIVEPRSAVYYDAVRVVLPMLVVLLIGGAVALVLSWGLSLTLAKPLRELERAAHAAAAGSYVRPLAVDRDDEIGAVSQAFNAVALRLNSLHDLSQLLASASQLDQVLDGILPAVGHLVGGGAVAIYLLENGRYVPVRTRGREMSKASPVEATDSNWLDCVLSGGRPEEYEGDPTELARHLPGYQGEGLRAYAVPLLARGERLGVVVIARHASRPFSDAETEMLRTFSAQAAVAVHTSRLFEHESESRRVAEALRLVAEELVRPEKLEDAVLAVERIVGDLFAAADVRIILGNPSTVGLRPSTRSGDAELLAIGLEAVAQGESHDAVTVRMGEHVHSDAVLEKLLADYAVLLPIAFESDHPAIMAVALRGGPLRENELVAARAIGDEVVLALDNAFFFQRALKRADNLENILNISQAVGSSLQINVVLNRVLEVVQKILAADALALMSYDPQRRTLSLSMGRGALPKVFTELQLEAGQDIPGEVFRRAEPVALRNMTADMGGIAGICAAAGLHSMLAVPLVARGHSIGVLIVFAAHKGGFAEEDANVLRTFAFQAALALDNARLYGREHEVAKVLQQAILPEALPELPELATGSVYQPAGEDIDIGGDYYDVFRVSDGRIWIAVGDVCGKGIHAATKTSMIKYILRALAEAGFEPAAITAQANDMISVSAGDQDIITLWIGRYDGSERRLTWSDGGHPPALLRRSDGTIEELGPTGPLLGAQPDIRYEDAHTNLELGDTLLIYTDGVTEARSGNIFFGVERVKAVLSSPGHPAEIARLLLAAVRDYVQGELRDDVAVLAVAPRAPEQP